MSELIDRAALRDAVIVGEVEDDIIAVIDAAPTVECGECEQRELARGVWECQWWEAPCLHEGGCSKFQRRQS